MTDFKFTTKEKVESLIFNLHEQEDCGCPIEFLKSQKELMRMTYSRDSILDQEKALELVETFLHLFEQSEDYEICANIIKVWPELKK